MSIFQRTVKRTVKCPFCEKPYAICTFHGGDQAACPKCRAHHYSGTTRGEVGFVSRCTCGWQSDEHKTHEWAQRAAAAHVRRERTPEPEAAAR